MSNSNEILKTSLLGSEKYLPNLSGDITPLVQKAICENKEAYFLRQANISFLFEKAGQNLPQKEFEFPECPKESKESISSINAQYLSSFLKEGQPLLLNFIFWHCNKQQKVLTPNLIPAVLTKALERIKNAAPLIEACGETGKWLCQLNNKWKDLITNNTSVEDWELGNIEARKTYLEAIRMSKPEAALNYLEQNLQSENATNRFVLLEVLLVHLSNIDVAFLLTLEKDKSQKVKELAMQLLAQIEGTAINTKLQNALLQLVSIKEERHLLVTKKKKIYFNDQAIIDDDIFKLRVEKISSSKAISDSVFISFQIISLLPPKQVCQVLSIDEKEFIHLIMKLPEYSQLRVYIEQTVIKHKHTIWAIEMLQEDKLASINLLDSISKDQREEYYIKFSNTAPLLLAEYLMDDNYTLFKFDLARNIISHLEKEPYQNDSHFYPRLAFYMPTEIIPNLEAIVSIEKEDYQFKYFKNQISEMIRIIEIKQTILKN